MNQWTHILGQQKESVFRGVCAYKIIRESNSEADSYRSTVEYKEYNRVQEWELKECNGDGRMKLVL
jgi:hypothetical protein